MAYYRVIMQEIITWQVLVVASDEAEAKAKARDSYSDDEPIGDETNVYDITELEIKK